MMKKLFFFGILLLILSGCGNGDRYNFSGSSENWDVFYTVDVIDSTSEETTGTIKYVGDEPVPQKINFKIGSKEGTNVEMEDGVTNIGHTSCRGCSVTQEDEEIAVEINWDGQMENAVLTTEE